MVTVPLAGPDTFMKISELPSEFTSELDFLEDYFEKKDGLNKMDQIDGEFVINYVDKSNNTLNIITDPFFTKPYFFSVNLFYCSIGIIHHTFFDIFTML